MSKCGAVNCRDTLTDGVKCSVCMKDFHFHCAGVTEAGYRKLGDRRSTWRCPTCKQVRSSPAPNSSLLPVSPASGDVMTLLHDINLKLAPLDQIISDMKDLKKGFAELKTAISTTNNSIAEFSKKITEMEARLCQVEGTKTDVITLQHKIEKLEVELNVRDQWSRMSNVEIKGIPLTKNENLYDIIASIGSKIDYPINGDQINYIARMPTRDPERIKPIVVCFNNRYRKENFIAAARKSFGPGKLTCAAWIPG